MAKQVGNPVSPTTTVDTSVDASSAAITAAAAGTTPKKRGSRPGVSKGPALRWTGDRINALVATIASLDPNPSMADLVTALQAHPSFADQASLVTGTKVKSELVKLTKLNPPLDASLIPASLMGRRKVTVDVASLNAMLAAAATPENQVAS